MGDTGIRNMAIGSNTATLGIMWVGGISPLRYLPKIQNHEVVFNTDMIKPSVEKVYDSACSVMMSLYNAY